MQPSDVLAQAVKTVEDAGVPDDLRVVAFEKAIDLIAGTDPLAIRRQDMAAASGDSAQGPSSSSSVMEAIANRLKLDPSIVREVFDVEEGVPILIVQSSKLATAKRAATKEIALLMVAARQAAGIDDYTMLADIRPMAEHFAKYDSNFSASINQMDDALSFKGKDKNRAVRLRQQGWEQATTLVSQLGGGKD